MPDGWISTGVSQNVSKMQPTLSYPGIGSSTHCGTVASPIG